MLEAMLASDAVYAIGWALVQFVWQGALAGIMIWAVLALLSGHDAQIRYWAACMSLLAMLALPLATGLRIYGDSRIDSVEVGRASAVIETNAVSPVPPSGPEALDTSASDEENAVFWPRWTHITVERWLPTVVLMWLIGVIGLSLRTAGGWLWVQRMRRTGKPLPQLMKMIEEVGQTLRLTRAVQVFKSACVEVPTVVGWLKPVVLLPASALTGLSPEQLRAIVAHELAHVIRHDYLINLFQSMAETLLFYHPIVWWLSRRIRIERERCADDLAVAACGDPTLYAGALADLEVARGRVALAMTATGGSLLDRIHRVLNRPHPRQHRPSLWLVVSAGIVVFVLTVSPGGTASVAPSLDFETPNTMGAAAAAPQQDSAAGLETVLDTRDQANSQPPSSTTVTDEQARLGVEATIEKEILQEAQITSPLPPPPPSRPTVQERFFSLDSESSGQIGVTVEDGEERGVVVQAVQADGPASDAGIEVGDVITEFDGSRVVGTRQLRRIVSETPVGRSVPVTVLRGGEEQSLEVTLRTATDGFRWNPDSFQSGIQDAIQTAREATEQVRNLEIFSDGIDFSGNFGRRSARVLGAQTESMTEELREFFGAASDEGVLVTSVDAESISATAGLHVGDVIVGVDGNRVDSPVDFRSLAGAVIASDNPVTLSVFRDQTALELTAEPE